MAALEQERQGQWRLSRCPIQEMVVWGKQLDPAQFQETYLKQKNNKIPILQECILLSYQLCEGHHLIPFCLVVKIKKSQKHLASRPLDPFYHPRRSFCLRSIGQVAGPR